MTVFPCFTSQSLPTIIQSTALLESPFFASNGFHPHFHPDIPMNSLLPAAVDLDTHLYQVHEKVKEYLRSTKDAYKHLADQGSKLSPTRTYGQSLVNHPESQPTHQLDNKYLVPFKILELDNMVMLKLQVPLSLKIHPVFHSSHKKVY